MDSKNVIAAISLSAAVIILYGLFFAPEPQPINQALQEKNNIVENSEAPKLIDTQEINTISRDEAINNSDRISFENENIIVKFKDYYFSNVIARSSKTMVECNNSKIDMKKTGTEG